MPRSNLTRRRAGLGRRSGVSPVIATLLLIAITVSAGVVLYVFVSGLSSRLAPTTGNQAGERFAMDAYSFPSPYTHPELTMRNIGSSSTMISAVYYDGTMCVSGSSQCSGATIESSKLPVQGTTVITLTVSAAQSGTTHQVKVVMTDGALFSTVVVAGQSG